MAVDDTFVKQIRLNGRDLPIDLGAAEIPIAAYVPLKPGSNRIHIEVIDICGKATEIEQYVACDRSGPLLNFDSTHGAATAASACGIKGSARDASGIRSIHINGEKLASAGGKRSPFNMDVVPARPDPGTSSRPRMVPAMSPRPLWRRMAARVGVTTPPCWRPMARHHTAFLIPNRLPLT
jgi:hypothetical protein